MSNTHATDDSILNWKFEDVLDFECARAADGNITDKAKRTRDRSLYEERIKPALSPEMLDDRRVLIRAWLEARRTEVDATLPGTHFKEGWQTLVMLALLLGLCLGGSVTAGLLHLQEPVNVSWLLAWTVGIQILFLLIVILLWILRAARFIPEGFRPLRSLLSALAWVVNAGLRRLPGEQRERIRASYAVIAHKREIYGSLAAWPFLIITQLFAVAYNVGILTTLLTHLAFTDMHFQWESTFVKSPAAAYSIVSKVSFPWSALVRNAHPSVEGLNDSQNIDPETFQQMLKDEEARRQSLKSTRDAHAPMEDARLKALKSWWPFLCYTVAVWGLGLRAILLGFACVKLRGALRALAFDDQDARALARRLRGPLVVAGPDGKPLEIPPHEVPTPDEHTAGICRALVADDVTIDESRLRDHLARSFGWRLSKIVPMKIDLRRENAVQFNDLRAAATEIVAVVIVVPMAHDPIVATALSLKDLIAAAGGKPEILLLLVGSAEDERRQYWQDFLAINNLHLGLECWRSQ